MDFMATLTVFTPAYNRDYSIHLCYESLCRQTCKDFVWLVIDDGSTDGTKALIEAWQKEDNGFVIEYIYKENGGMHTAHNTAYEHMETELNVCIDSDDYMTDDAVEIIVENWKKYGSDDYAGIIALDITADKQVIGTELPADKKDISLSAFYRNGGKGDKKLIYRTDVMKKYPPYPVFPGEKYVSLAYKYSLADLEYTLLVVNKPVCVVEYRTDGSSHNMLRQYYTNPRGFAFIRKFNMKLAPTFRGVYRNCIHYVSSSLLMHNRKFIRESPKKMHTVLAVIPGWLLSRYIKHKVAEK